MWQLACPYSTGDAFLVCALAESFQKVHGPLTIILKPQHEDIARMFGVRYVLADVPAEGISEFRRGRTVLMHPNHLPVEGHIDGWVTREGFSQADLYRFLMRLPHDAPLSRARLLDDWRTAAGRLAQELAIKPDRTVVLMPGAKSWPTTPPPFWEHLAESAAALGWKVLWNEASSRTHTSISPSLGVLYALMELCGWVVGAQSGGFCIAAASQVRARKTLVVQGWPEGSEMRVGEHIVIQRPFPYGRVRKFDGRDYAVEEHVVVDERDWPAVVEEICSGPNALGAPIRTGTTRSAWAPTSPGDLADKLSILLIKLDEVRDVEGHRAVVRETTELLDAWGTTFGAFDADSPDIAGLLDENRHGWRVNAELYDTWAGDFGTADWQPDVTTPEAVAELAHRVRLYRASADSNRRRVALKNKITSALSGAWIEAKTYDMTATPRRNPQDGAGARPAEPPRPSASGRTEAARKDNVVLQVEVEILRRTLFSLQMDLDARERTRLARVAAQVIGTFAPSPEVPLPPVAEAIATRLSEEGCCDIEGMLTREQAAEVAAYFRTRPCFNGHVKEESDGVPRRVGGGAEAFHYGSYALEDIVAAPYLIEIANDPGILAIAGRYLDCTPTLYSLNAWWSFAGHAVGAPTAQSYHRDLDGLRFCTLFVYLTDVDAEGGPHVYVRRTHRPDRMQAEIDAASFRLGRFPAAVTDALATGALYRGQAYGLDHVVEPLFSGLAETFMGPAGSGLIADTYGFHKGIPPRRTRLMFWARYGTHVNLGPGAPPVDPALVAGRIPRDDRARFINRAIVRP